MSRRQLILESMQSSDLPEDTIIDLSQPGIIHYIYPTGRKVPDHMMDPNIGGFRGKEKED